MKIGIDVNILRNYIPRLLDMYVKEYGENPLKDEVNPYSLEECFNSDIYDFIGENILEIFGFAKESERGLISYCNQLQKKYNNHQFYIICNGFEMMIPSTLHFLCKMNCDIQNYIFRKNSIDLWEEVDIIITDNPFLIDNKPNNKKVIKVKKFYNLNNNSDYTINNLIEIENERIL
jgi:hypothetical protein